MWSLPDINRMNAAAAANAGCLEAACKAGSLEGEKLTCEHEDDNCTGALRHYLWYDIFSDDPKGILTLCERHDGYFGSPAEGYFYCGDCRRVMTENYTWELYYVVSDDGEQLCLPCHAKRELRNLDNWIPLTREDIAGITFKHVRRAKHLIGVGMPMPDDIEEFGEGVTLDSSTGGKVRGFTRADEDPADGVEELKAVLIGRYERRAQARDSDSRWRVPVRREHRRVRADEGGGVMTIMVRLDVLVFAMGFGWRCRGHGSSCLGHIGRPHRKEG